MPIHLIWGNDEAAITNEIQTLINQVIEPSWSSINLTRLDGSNVDQAIQALEEARTPPFGTGGRLVILHRSPYCNGCSAQLANRLEASLDLIPENSHLILNNPNKPDGRLRTSKSLQKLIKLKLAIEKSFVLPAIWDLEGQRKLVERTAKNLRLNLEPEAANALVETIGTDSNRLTSELEKLALHASTNQESSKPQSELTLITIESVKALIKGMATNSLQISNSLLQGETINAIAKLDELINTGEPPLRILATLTGQVRGWLWVSLLDNQGEKDVGVIAKAAGINNPKRIYVIRKQLQNQPSRHFLQLLSQLLEIEASIKRGVLPRQAFRDGLLNNS